jgi:hypothetical protein
MVGDKYSCAWKFTESVGWRCQKWWTSLDFNLHLPESGRILSL